MRVTSEQNQETRRLSDVGLGISLAGLFIAIGITINGFMTSQAIKKSNPLHFLKNIEDYSFNLKGKQQGEGFIWKLQTKEHKYEGGFKTSDYGDEFEIYTDYKPQK